MWNRLDVAQWINLLHIGFCVFAVLISWNLFEEPYNYLTGAFFYSFLVSLCSFMYTAMAHERIAALEKDLEYYHNKEDDDRWG